ncbi:MAG: SUMF1/EgtB/PvdO family nonheme iron enzyme, partial [Bacteroidales bacterium]|nr:SUMF1/EgtB/PvdO family nonheme iron enzyme [Candidatus Colimorpha onthohippi]
MKCNKCGKEIPEESKYCMYCGEPIADQLALEDGAITINVGIGSFVMNLVEHGTFEMGATAEQQQAESNESPAHKVTLSHDYYIGQTAVPQWLYRSITGSNPSKYTGDKRPVDSVSYGDAKDFINKLNMKVASQLNGKKFRLPTEAEWEYAARGGKKSQHTIY